MDGSAKDSWSRDCFYRVYWCISKAFIHLLEVNGYFVSFAKHLVLHLNLLRKKSQRKVKDLS